MNQLKTIAMVFMLVDHIAYVMIERGLGYGGNLYMINRFKYSLELLVL